MPSRKKESDGLSSSALGATKSSEIKRSSTFSLSRLLPSRRRSKSRLSLDSDPTSTRVEAGACIQLAPTSQVEASHVASSQSSLPPHLSSMGFHPTSNCNSPVIHVHRSTASCHSASHDEGNNLMFFGGGVGGSSGDGGGVSSRHPSAASADCLLESSSSSSSGGGISGRGVVPGTMADPSMDCDGGSGGSSNAGGTVGDHSGSGVGMVECPVCLVDKPKEDFPEISTCHHRSCTTCLKQYFRIEIMESRITIACPECSELFHPNDIKTIVEDDVLTQKYEDFMLRRVLAIDPDTRWCPAPDCGYAVIATGCASCPKLRCERSGCNTNFCYHCKQYWHPNQTCDAARAERSPNIRSVSVSYSQESAGQNEIKSCPRCSAFIIKMDDESCNHMTCAVCEAHFCWLCLKEVSDLHYLSPSGCTFWGRKQWSRKKKILWQLGILVGAPVGITLVAGLAVPAMIIGIPVWVGKKIHYRYELASRRKRGLAITGSVTASIFAAPIIATLAVGIGVPILLTYIYGVVPISLCRSGGCGVTTTNSGGVRFEFDEDNENNTRGAYSYTGDYHSMETGPNVANPSIAPSIGDASLGMTNSLSASGSHMDRVGVLRDDSDRDSSSHRAMAGTSINGSLCSATYSTQHHKLEVQADISEHGGLCERTSMGGESYNVSLNDDASTKALAGSLISPKDKDGVSVCSRLCDGSGNVTTAPLVYPEEMDVKEMSGSHHPNAGSTSSSSPLSSSSSSTAAAPIPYAPHPPHQTSSSCPTSPNLRKSSSPAPTDDGKSTRGKKCTRFMDQVPEIDDMKCDMSGSMGSVGSVLSDGSTLGLSDHGHHVNNACMAPITTTTASGGPPTFSTMSLTSAPTTTRMSPVVASCHSLASDEEGGGRREGLGMIPGSPHSRLGKKAESTSVLMDSAESRRYEMAGNHRKGEAMMRYAGEDCCSGQGVGKHAGGRRGDKEHGSQPINLSDICQVSEGMSVHHTAGCHNLLSAMDASDRDATNLLSRGGGHKSGYFHNSISSSSSSSMDDTGDFVSLTSSGSRRFSHNKHSLGRSLEGVKEDLYSTGEDVVCSGSGNEDKVCSGSSSKRKGDEDDQSLDKFEGSCCLTDVDIIEVGFNNGPDNATVNDSVIPRKLDASDCHPHRQWDNASSKDDNSVCRNEEVPHPDSVRTLNAGDSNVSKRDSTSNSSSFVSQTILSSPPESSSLPEVEETSPGMLHPLNKESRHYQKVNTMTERGSSDDDGKNVLIPRPPFQPSHNQEKNTSLAIGSELNHSNL